MPMLIKRSKTYTACPIEAQGNALNLACDDREALKCLEGRPHLQIRRPRKSFPALDGAHVKTDLCWRLVGQRASS